MKHVAMTTMMFVFLLNLGSVSSYALEVIKRKKVGPWIVTTQKDEFTDELFVSVTSIGKRFHSLYSTDEHRTLLTILCTDNRTTVGIDWGEYYHWSKNSKLMEMRIDDEPATDEIYYAKDSSIYIGTGKSAITQVKSMFDNSELKARISMGGELLPYTLTTSFDISRLEKAIKPVRELCNW